MKPELFVLSLAGLVLGLGAFQIQPLVNETKNDEWVWVSLPGPKDLFRVFYTELSEHKGPAYTYRVEPNSGHPWAIKEYLNDTLKISVIVETHQKEIVSGAFQIAPSEGASRDSSSRVQPVRKYAICAGEPRDCESLNRPKIFCIPTPSHINDQRCACGGRLIFSETFENESWKNNWLNLEQSQRLPPYYEGVAFVKHSHNSYVADNGLHLEVTPSKYNQKNPFFLENCTKRNTGRKKSFCGSKKHNKNSKKLWPLFTSASIKSISTFKYCRVEIEAQLPIGDWLFPVLSLKSDKKHSIRIAIVRGNDKLKDSAGNEVGGRSLFAGAIIHPNSHEAMRHDSIGKHFGEDFHTYTAIWKENIIIFKVDGRTYAEITNRDILEKFNGSSCHIELGVTVGGEYNFPDSRILADQKPFRNKDGLRKDTINSTAWKQPKLVVRSVRVYSITDYEQ